MDLSSSSSTATTIPKLNQVAPSQPQDVSTILLTSDQSPQASPPPHTTPTLRTLQLSTDTRSLSGANGANILIKKSPGKRDSLCRFLDHLNWFRLPTCQATRASSVCCLSRREMADVFCVTGGIVSITGICIICLGVFPKSQVSWFV